MPSPGGGLPTAVGDQLRRFGGGVADSADFERLAKEVSGQNLDAFFTAWLEDPLIPDMPEYGLYKEDYRH